ncbi:hypothetical protein [Desulfocurvus sp.]|jgi:hypothetical protein|uniref:hypothetical protein n=1 Tax=Desulfocurvus sp. TaxID=2871698 RepID=UPI0025B809A2|nr:hypothetical protein [Desulfocurvus sp.]MCK9240420.1 hypothetical protein [Desulfocurvus sp.]
MGHSERYESAIAARIRLMAFAFNHDSEISACEGRRPISLVNVHTGGARLRKQRGVAYCGLNVGDAVVLDLRLLSETANLQGRVSWTSGEDVFVDFGTPLSVGVADLQGAIDN